MTEKELLRLFIQERLNMLLVSLRKTQPKKSYEEHKRIFKAESFIDSLPDEERKLVQGYMEELTELLATEEPYLYHQGFSDGIRVLNYLRAL